MNDKKDLDEETSGKAAHDAAITLTSNLINNMLAAGEAHTDNALRMYRKNLAIAAVHAGLAQMSAATQSVPTGREETKLRKGKS
jgi:hypothetical protein